MRNLFIFLVIGITASSCVQELTPYTSRVHRETGLSGEQLKKVQFYNSQRIVLYREVGKNTTEVVSGEIKIIDGKRIEQVVINPNTPGVLVSAPNSDRFGVSFEKGPDRFLIFGSNSKRRGYYAILARDWTGSSAKIDYDGKVYKLAPESSEAILLVNMKKLRSMKVNSRTAGGIRIQ
ncbi:hypothetical protein QQ008_17655 [Fulvivirgaceae bacterium BMA10]|uniref:Uncharacterized protein n=1 Tax=Splendidivirga corallicola TaxID=3051826 RepID=A0ABT8KUQ7_9BACT|nr:hypothetical protein [Fulvivirgaceae bacterium BMA10]